MRTAKFLLAVALGSLTLFSHPSAAAEPTAARPPSSVRGKRPARLKPAAKPPRPANLNLPPAPSASGTLLLPWFLREKERAAPPAQRRPLVTLEGILVGDYYLVPNLLFGTDNRYDDVNTRERALRDDLNYMESRRHGEIHIDPLNQLLRKHAQRFNDPGFQVAMVIHHLLQGALQPPVRSVEQVMRLDVTGRGPASAAQALLVTPAQESTANPPPAPVALDLRR
jgi:hypothetical protein